MLSYESDETFYAGPMTVRTHPIPADMKHWTKQRGFTSNDRSSVLRHVAKYGTIISENPSYIHRFGKWHECSGQMWTVRTSSGEKMYIEIHRKDR